MKVFNESYFFEKKLNYNIIIKYFFIKYFYINNFIKFIFNKYFYIYLKSFSSSKTIYWTLFSYTVDKYYVSINKTIKHNQSYFIKHTNIIYLNKKIYTNNLIKFKKKNSSFKTSENLNFFLWKEFYRYNQKSLINFVSTNTSQLIFQKQLKNTPLFFKKKHINYFNETSPFNFKLKNLISKNRKLLVEFFNFKLKRQYRITRFIINFIKFKVKNFFNFDFRLLSALSASKLIFSINDGFNFIKHGFVYVNNCQNINPNFFLKKGDKIQLIFSINYYHDYYINFNEFTKINSKYYNRFFKNTNNNFYLFKEKNVNNLMLTLNSFKKGTPRFLEIDFLTLSFVIIFTPNNSIFLNNYSNYIYNFYLNRLYNWKFIT